MLLLSPQPVRKADDIARLQLSIELGELHCEAKKPLILAQGNGSRQFTGSTGLRIEKLVKHLAGLRLHYVQAAKEVP
jgi:hypothetical protein